MLGAACDAAKKYSGEIVEEPERRMLAPAKQLVAAGYKDHVGGVKTCHPVC